MRDQRAGEDSSLFCRGCGALGSMCRCKEPCEAYRCRRTDTALFIIYGPGKRERVMNLCPTHQEGYDRG